MLKWRAMLAPARIRGVTLVELIVFIVIAGIAMVVLVQVFALTTRGSHTGKQLTQGIHLAQQRLEVIRGQRERLGYAGFTAGDLRPLPAGRGLDRCECFTHVWGGYTSPSSGQRTPARLNNLPPPVFFCYQLTREVTNVDWHGRVALGASDARTA